MNDSYVEILVRHPIFFREKIQDSNTCIIGADSQIFKELMASKPKNSSHHQGLISRKN